MLGPVPFSTRMTPLPRTPHSGLQTWASVTSSLSLAWLASSPLVPRSPALVSLTAVPAACYQSAPRPRQAKPLAPLSPYEAPQLRLALSGSWSPRARAGWGSSIVQGRYRRKVPKLTCWRASTKDDPRPPTGKWSPPPHTDHPSAAICTLRPRGWNLNRATLNVPPGLRGGHPCGSDCKIGCPAGGGIQSRGTFGCWRRRQRESPPWSALSQIFPQQEPRRQGGIGGMEEEEGLAQLAPG